MEKYRQFLSSDGFVKMMNGVIYKQFRSGYESCENRIFVLVRLQARWRIHKYVKKDFRPVLKIVVKQAYRKIKKEIKKKAGAV